jgi:2-alkenal reductase
MTWKRASYIFVIILVAGISGLVGAGVGGLITYRTVQEHLVSQAEESALQTPTPAPSEREIITTSIDTAITQAVEEVGQAVVTVVGVIPGQPTLFGRTPDRPVSGSGVIISEDGYILTNNHVIEDTQQVAVILADGTQLEAQIVGTDLFSDLAVLQAKGEIPAVARLGNSDALRPGETVIAIGSPLGDFKNTVTAGVVSATERSIEVSENYFMEGLIQTDAAINQGNSGGPLVNLAGEVIGINTLIVRGGNYGSPIAEGLGFAIPANKAQAVAAQLIDQGYFSYPYLGIRWQWLTTRITHMYNMPVEGGVYVSYVEPNSPADAAGLQAEDIITHIGDQEINEENPYINVLYSYEPGDETTITVVRGQETIELTVTFSERPNQ